MKREKDKWKLKRKKSTQVRKYDQNIQAGLALKYLDSDINVNTLTLWITNSGLTIWEGWDKTDKGSIKELHTHAL